MPHDAPWRRTKDGHLILAALRWARAGRTTRQNEHAGGCPTPMLPLQRRPRESPEVVRLPLWRQRPQ
eukprot:6560871-Lingulodinium_polyedra.AAC.1